MKKAKVNERKHMASLVHSYALAPAPDPALFQHVFPSKHPNPLSSSVSLGKERCLSDLFFLGKTHAKRSGKDGSKRTLQKPVQEHCTSSFSPSCHLSLTLRNFTMATSLLRRSLLPLLAPGSLLSPPFRRSAISCRNPHIASAKNERERGAPPPT